MIIQDSKILITGANRGIGLALVEKALEKGAAKIYATYRSEKIVEHLKRWAKKLFLLILTLAIGKQLKNFQRWCLH
jgi:NAD(P)-dependent dehydrogenase (short-subunit alcohol dehydrogenase family)